MNAMVRDLKNAEEEFLITSSLNSPVWPLKERTGSQRMAANQSRGDSNDSFCIFARAD